MKIALKAGKPLDITTELLVVPVFSFDKKKGAELPAPLSQLDRALGKVYADQLKEYEFVGSRDQSHTLVTLGKSAAARVIAYGLGDAAKLSDVEVRSAFAKLARQLLNERARNVHIALPDGLLGQLRHVAEGLLLGSYRFTKYFTGARKPKTGPTQLTLLTAATPTAAQKAALEQGRAVAEAVNQARDLSNEPGNELYPQTFADAAVALGKEKKLSVKVLGYDAIRAQGMKLIEAVGQGSERKPCMVHITYRPAGAKKKGAQSKRLVFVGKGITFDSGGLSIKPAAGMGEMKHDMSGAASVFGLMQAVADLQPNIEVHGIIVCAENMPDGNAYRPGDIWGSFEGKTVEVNNTDAEGRLVLADALSYAHRLQPDFLTCVATLTGACVVGLGESCSGWYALNRDSAKQFQAAVDLSGEQMWQMPLLEELRDQIKSECADMKNTGERYGGSITAALFLREFIGDAKNWVHCDIAGPAMASRAYRWDPKGGSGHSVLTFLAMVEQAAAKK